jgi:cell division septum initiation protein DivIVA
MMSSPLRHADQLLTELIELVETARAVPMSSSCVLPREHVLDLLDELREVMPVEMEDARRVIAQRDAVLAEAQLQAERTLELARHQATTLVDDGGTRAAEMLEEARSEQARLVSETAVHQSARETAERLRTDAQHYADRTLADLLAVLQRAVATTEQGRAALRDQRAAAPGETVISGPAHD